MDMGALMRRSLSLYLSLESICLTNGSMENARTALAENARDRAIRDTVASVAGLQRSA